MLIEPTTEVTLYDLLRQREHAFVEVHEYEQRIEQILGSAYTALLPPSLPSLAKKKRKAAKKPKKARRIIRRLKPDTEDAYAVNYDYKGSSYTEVLREYRLIQLLVKSDVPNLLITSISSVAYTDDEEFETVQKLFNNSPAS